MIWTNLTNNLAEPLVFKWMTKSHSNIPFSKFTKWVVLLFFFFFVCLGKPEICFTANLTNEASEMSIPDTSHYPSGVLFRTGEEGRQNRQSVMTGQGPDKCFCKKAFTHDQFWFSTSCSQKPAITEVAEPTRAAWLVYQHHVIYTSNLSSGSKSNIFPFLCAKSMLFKCIKYSYNYYNWFNNDEIWLFQIK